MFGNKTCSPAQNFAQNKVNKGVSAMNQRFPGPLRLLVARSICK
jgi:hypothetical protein